MHCTASCCVLHDAMTRADSGVCRCTLLAKLANTRSRRLGSPSTKQVSQWSSTDRPESSTRRSEKCELISEPTSTRDVDPRLVEARRASNSKSSMSLDMRRDSCAILSRARLRISGSTDSSDASRSAYARTVVSGVRNSWATSARKTRMSASDRDLVSTACLRLSTISVIDD